MFHHQPERPLWQNDALFQINNSDVLFSGSPLSEVYVNRAMPLYVYSAQRITQNIQKLDLELSKTGLPYTIHYAMKANRNKAVLHHIRNTPGVCIDACSPNEVDLALSCGFKPEEVSVTASNLSNSDLDRLASHAVHLNSDTHSVFSRLAARARSNQTVGIRLDPPLPLQREVGDKLNYVGSKFGVSEPELPALVEHVLALGLRLTTLHVHCGWAMQQSHAGAFDEALELVTRIAKKYPFITDVNIGGGLSPKHHARDNPLTVEQWGATIRRHLQGLSVRIRCEIGTFIMADAGLLLMEINTVEHRKGAWWAGVNSGHSINLYPYQYQIPLQLIPVSNALAEYNTEYTIGSNINEANDVLARNVVLPPLKEGNLIAMYPAGAYGSSMASNHCLRGDFDEVLL